MAHNPQAPNGAPDQDPAGSTQMFQAFVDEKPGAKQQPAGGSRAGLITGVVAAGAVLVVLAVVLL